MNLKQKSKRKQRIISLTNSSMFYSYPWITLRRVIKSRITKEIIRPSWESNEEERDLF